MLTERIGGISIVDGGEDVTTREIVKGDEVGKAEPLGGGMCSGNHRSAHSMRRGQVVHLEVVMFDGRIVEDEGQEDKVVVDVREQELMMYIR